MSGSLIRGIVAYSFWKVKAEGALLLSLQSLLQSDGQLIGAAGGLAAAADAAQALDSLLNAHTLDELGNTLQVTVATTVESTFL